MLFVEGGGKELQDRPYAPDWKEGTTARKKVLSEVRMENVLKV